MFFYRQHIFILMRFEYAIFDAGGVLPNPFKDNSVPASAVMNA
jgi:hypothetical protein